MTVHDGPDEPGAMSSSPPITWQPVDALDLFEARIIDEGGRALYVGYVGHTPRDGDDQWRGYIGVTHVPVGMGRREAVQAAVERAAREAWAARRVGACDQGIVTGAHDGHV